MKIFFATECGETTCAVEPGKFCHFSGAKNFGQQPWCRWYDVKLLEQNGWVLRCKECLDEHGPYEVK